MKITGTIIDSTKQVLPGYRVVAYHGDVNLEKEKSVATGEMGGGGTYSLSVNLAHYLLGVNVCIAVLNKRLKGSSPIHYNAHDNLVIDVNGWRHD